MEKKMLYISFFSACAGLFTCMYNVAFEGDMSYTNMFLFIFFCVIAMALAKIDVNIRHQEEQDLLKKQKQTGDNLYTERV
jgi:hypothetical protein